MVTTPMSLAGTVARAGAGLALDAGGKVATAPLRAVESGVQWAAAGTEALLPETTARLREETVRWRDDLIDLIDPRPDRTHRRVDLHEQRATVEVRGLDGDRAPDIAEALGKRLDRLRAVRWWEINSVTGRVVA
ncbi:hypothetical protein, partial [Nocardia farcinica]